jgi:hypothetical protein
MALWPIFNIADASIFVGVAIILLFQNKFFGEKEPHAEMREVTASASVDGQSLGNQSLGSQSRESAI